jgi:hypothetical protein
MSAKNEQLKLKAQFWNGLAIAAAAAGIVLPFLGAYSNDELWNAPVFPVFSNLAYKTFLTMGVAFSAAILFRSLANSCASKIND